MEHTPWPIELHDHPFGTRKEIKKGAVEQQKESYIEDEAEPRSPEEIAQQCFDNPEKYREDILKKVSAERQEDFNGDSVYYIWLNKTCPVGCEFCFFRSPTKAEQRSETEITDEGIDNLVNITEDGKIDKFVISGGGEPMMSREKVYELSRRLKVKDVVVVTSAYWSKTPEKTDDILKNMKKATVDNAHGPTMTVRLSLDKCHFERLCRAKDFGYVKNLTDWFAANAKDDPKFKLLIHTMEGDDTVEKFLSTVPIKSREEKGKPLNRKTQVTLENGLVFNIEYSQIFDSNPDVDLTDESQQMNNAETFKDFLDKRRNGNMSVSFHGDAPKGAYFLTFYDGNTIIWGATSPDSETSIYKDNYKQIMEKNLNDVITLAALEKGPLHMQEIVKEVNPKAVTRAVGVGLRDFYPRLLLEEDTTRLYVSVRLMQEYIAEGKIDAEQIKSWPKELQTLVKIDADQLKKACLDSKFNIVTQYLQDTNVSAPILESLYNRVCLGHYSITPEQMFDQVMSSKLPSNMKDEFHQLVSKRMTQTIAAA